MKMQKSVLVNLGVAAHDLTIANKVHSMLCSFVESFFRKYTFWKQNFNSSEASHVHQTFALSLSAFSTSSAALSTVWPSLFLLWIRWYLQTQVSCTSMMWMVHPVTCTSNHGFCVEFYSHHCKLVSQETQIQNQHSGKKVCSPWTANAQHNDATSFHRKHKLAIFKDCQTIPQLFFIF